MKSLFRKSKKALKKIFKGMKFGIRTLIIKKRISVNISLKRQVAEFNEEQLINL